MSKTKERIRDSQLRYKQGLGQNFIYDEDLLAALVRAAGVTKEDDVLEVGPGAGSMTKHLCKAAHHVMSVELDDRLFPILEETLSEFDNVKVIHGDAMKYDLAGLIAEEFKGLRVAVCANLPYYITSPLIMRLLEEKLPIETITVMVQKEAAQRLCAPIGSRESGAVSVAVAFYGTAKTLFQVSRGSFMPAPNVDSAVIQITLHKEKPWQVADEATFFRMVKVGFSQRRKQLSGVLAGGLGIPKARMQEIFSQAEIPASARIESLTMEELVRLANVLAGEAV